MPQVSASSISKSPPLRKRIVAAAAVPSPLRILPDWQLGSELNVVQQGQLKFDVEVAIKVLQKYMQVGWEGLNAWSAAWLLHGRCGPLLATAWLLRGRCVAAA